MQTSNFIFQPETSSLWTWVIISGVLLLAALFGMLKLGKKKKATESKQRSSPLYFLLTGIAFLLFMTILLFNLFNLSQTRPFVIDQDKVSVGSRSMQLVNIRKTKVHREGSGVPFQGVGIKSGTSNSLIIEGMDGKTIILSEDFYPINEISQAIRTVKKK